MSPFQDHPSVGQLSDKLLENHIYSVFAVEKQQYQWYEVMSPTHVHAPVYRSARICEWENKRFRLSWSSEDRDQTPALPCTHFTAHLECSRLWNFTEIYGGATLKAPVCFSCCLSRSWYACYPLPTWESWASSRPQISLSWWWMHTRY